MRMRFPLKAALLAAAGLAATVTLATTATTAGAAASNADKCSAAKMKVAAKYASCRMAVDAKAATSGATPDYTDCVTKQTSGFAKVEDKYGADCPTTGDHASVQSDLDEALDCVATGLGGTPGACDLQTATLCGNGVVDPGEVCDQGAMNGGTCTSASGGVKNLGTLKCGANCLSYDTSSCLKCPATNSADIDGTCWILGGASQSCDQACGNIGMTYSTQTASLGNFVNCAKIADAVGATPSFFQDNNGPLPGSTGCLFLGASLYWRGDAATTSSGIYSGGSRICACQ